MTLRSRQLLNVILADVLNISAQLAALNKKVDRLVSDQASVDAAMANIETAETAEAAFEADTATQLTTIGTELAALEAAANSGQPLNFDTINAAVAAAQANTTQAAAVDTSAQADAAAGAPPA